MSRILKYQIYVVLSIIYMMIASISYANAPFDTVAMTRDFTTEAGTVRITSNSSFVYTKIHLNIEFKLNDGWKIYHKDTPDAGIPLEFIEQNSNNITVSDFKYPPPQKFEDFGVMTLGYEGDVNIGFSVNIVDPSQPIIFDKILFYGACREVCMPIEHHIAFEIAPPEYTSKIVLDKQKADVGFRPSALDGIADRMMPIDLGDNNAENRLSRLYIEFDALSIINILIMSILAGFILNFMPCVFPILSLKVFAVSHANRATMAYMSMGIISVFTILGGVISLAKTSFGWGFQFQYVWFLALMNILLVFMILNLFGRFEIHPPNRLVHMFPEGNSQNARAFFNGATVTLLATPCSAPLVGTALGFALGAPVYFAILLFICMGMGMALPYIVIYIFPSFAKKLPKPGGWMKRLKYAFIIPLLGLVAYLLYIQTTAMVPKLAILTVVLIILMAIIQYTRMWYYRIVVPVLAGIIVFTAVIGGRNFLVYTLPPPWIKFQPDMIPVFVYDNKTVVVDVTASWCVTCAVNKFTTYDTQQVKQAMAQENIVMMQADWSVPNDSILKYIQSWNRNGIPLTVVYTPEKPQGVLLPEILTPNILLNAIKAP